MHKQRGFAHLFLFLLVLIFIIAVLGFVLYNKGAFKINNSQSLPNPASLLKNEYQNPFEEEASYSNPFSPTEYTNPFESLE